MKRFLRNVLLLAMACVLTLFCLSRVYLKILNTPYQRQQDETLQLNTMPEKADVVTFGSSHAGNSFQPQRCPEGTLLPLCLPLQTPVMDYAMYRCFRDRFSEDAAVVIVLSSFSLYWEDAPPEYYTHLKRYCTFLPLEYFPSVRAKLYKLFRVCDFQISDVADFLMNKQPAPAGSGETTTKASRFSSEELALIGRERSAVHLDLCAKSRDGKVNPETDRALRAMLTDCAQRGYRVILVTVPYLEEYNRHFPKELLDRFQRDVNAYAEAYRVPYLDYSHDERFTHSPELFVDTDHLTSDGSEQFMRIVFQDAEAFYAQNAN